MAYQHTLAAPFSISGVGLHTGVNVNLRLCPAPANSGVQFRRSDLEGFTIEAQSRNVARVSYATSLMKKGVLISTTEHLLSALAGLEVDNALVEIDNLELPILDGSARPFVELITKAGIRRQRAKRTFIKILKPVEVIDGMRRMVAYPADVFRVTYHIAFPHPLIGAQSFEFISGSSTYATEIAPARTFGFLEELEMLRKNGLIRGGSLENAVVLNHSSVINPEGLRFPDEFCRHKLLDLIGDFSLLGHPLLGHVVAERAGHAMHAQLISRLLREKHSWKLVSGLEAGAKAVSQPAPVLATSEVS
ncbi:MAG TPA: UDP-3-O-acyl-N-acetylglucosamine deacetylase [Terriglobia bacterium]|nr:UDP-3-O-acyl-N-acetylglucosamine deacetylase [Terriglobia bacterium]